MPDEYDDDPPRKRVRPRRDDDEAYEERPRRRRREDDDDRPRRRRDYDDDDDYDDRPRRRRRDEEEGDATGGLIPYKNGMALAAYYCGVFSLIPFLGLILGPIAFVLGILGLRYAGRHPKARGQVHAIVGIGLATFTLLYHIVFALWAYAQTK